MFKRKTLSGPAKPAPIDKGRQKVYTDKSGNVYYTMEPLALLPVQRFHHAQMILEGWQAKMGPAQALANLTAASQLLTLPADATLDSLNSIIANVVKAKGTIDMMRDQLSMEVSAMALLEIAAAMYAWNDEPWVDTTANMMAQAQAKIEVWKNDAQAQDFFLRSAWKRSANLPNWSDSTTLPYLIRQIHHQTAIEQILSTLTPTLPNAPS